MAARKPRGCTSPYRYMQLRNRRYNVLRDVAGLDADVAADASTNPVRFAESMRQLGYDPGQWPELTRVYIGGKPRLATPRAERNKVYYHELRKLGADSRFASEYSKGPMAFARGKRILRGEEVE